jgi:predicted glycogen debranching enzyme
LDLNTIKFSEPVLYEDVSNLEWIVTNGIGGYASGTASGLNTRRYHGVLVASYNPPTERMVLVSKVEEIIYHDKKDHNLATNRYHGDLIQPQGYKYLRSFTRVPLPCSTFRCGDAELEKTVFMVHESNTTVVEYRNTSHVPYLLKLNAHYVHRDYHGLQHERANFDFQVKIHNATRIIYAYYGASQVCFRHTHGTFHENRYWNKNLEYEIDKERGQDHREDNYSIGTVEYQLEAGQSTFLIFSTEENMAKADPAQLKEAELKRLSQLVPAGITDNFLRDLIMSGEQFIVQRRTTDSYSVIAGYHWFTDWGRDSMIAIRGLCIEQGKQEEARSVIVTFLSYLKHGIIPNRFPDYKGDMCEYNTVDATLWLFVAVYEYDQKFNDKQFLVEIYPRLAEIIRYHMRGTLHNIHVTEKGFISQGAKNVQLTWMDARIKDVVFTPREGCPVEINALWYNAMKIFNYVCDKISKERDTALQEVLASFEENFLKSFWNRDGYLNDIITTDRQADTAVRPNQVYAISLPFCLLPEKESLFVLESVRKSLLTPYGLRTLHPQHPDFKPQYSGDVWQRDAAYHQGTVWPFLLPEYFMAYLRLNEFSEEAKKEVSSYLGPLKQHFYSEACIHGISEIFDGLEPRKGKGCMHQAWSVSNLIMLMMKAGLSA